MYTGWQLISWVIITNAVTVFIFLAAGQAEIDHTRLKMSRCGGMRRVRAYTFTAWQVTAIVAANTFLVSFIGWVIRC